MLCCPYCSQLSTTLNNIVEVELRVVDNRERREQHTTLFKSVLGNIAFKLLLYSSGFVSIRQPSVPSIDNASFKSKNIRAGNPDVFMSMIDTKATHMYKTSSHTQLWLS